MARCYGCNSANATNRRYVNTGNSFSTYYGKRVSSGTRSYYAYKFFCHDCVQALDKARQKRRAVILILIAVALMWYLLATRF